MNPEWRKRIQIFLAVLVMLAGVRLYLIYRERNAPATAGRNDAEIKAVSADVYVVPRKVHAYDLKSAKFLAGKTVWVQAGNQMLYFPYSSHRSDFNHPVGLLPPLDRLEIKEVMLETDPLRQHKIMAIFTKSGDNKPYATSVGIMRGEDYSLYIDDALFLDDPHELYKHWPKDIWDAIEHHQVKAGMNELQTNFSLGAGVARSSGDYGNRTLEYSLNDRKTAVSFSNDRAIDIQESKQ